MNLLTPTLTLTATPLLADQASLNKAYKEQISGLEKKLEADTQMLQAELEHERARGYVPVCLGAQRVASLPRLPTSTSGLSL